MNERFSYNRELAAASRPRRRDFPKWIRITHISGSVLNDSQGSDRKRIVAIVSRPIPTDVEGKTIRRILIFDNHPDSLCLIPNSGAHLNIDEAGSQWQRQTPIICGSILIAAIIGAMLCPLFW